MAANTAKYSRFHVTEVEDGDVVDGGGEGPSTDEGIVELFPEDEDTDRSDRHQSTITSENNFALYEEDLENRPRISAFLSSIAQYDSNPPNPNTIRGAKGADGKTKQKKVKLGTFLGVYLPTVQSILGVILFIRLPWAVGQAGVGQAFLCMFICCLCTFVVALSLSAIATNGVVPAGGPYFLISANLGPEFGGATGIVFYLAHTFSVSLFVLGAIELLVVYIAPEMVLFGSITGNADVLYNNMRLYGTILLILIGLVVFFGVRFISIVGVVSLVLVLLSCISVYAGALNPNPRVWICTLDGVALEGQISCSSYNYSDVSEVYQNITKRYCHPSDPYLRQVFNGTTYMKNGEWLIEPMCKIGVPGLTATNTINENAAPMYLKEGEAKPGQQGQGIQVTATIDADFFVLIGILFNAVTGILTGSSRSGDLKDAQKSIPAGTILATLTTSMLYLSCVLIFGGTMDGFYLRDQLGDSASLPIAMLAWPTKWVVLIGAFVASASCALQSLTSAPRVLQAIANDNLIPVLKIFGTVGFRGEPTFALFLTMALAELGVLIASVDHVAPIITMFFLIKYLIVNLACALQSLLKAPNWRPRFRFYHWSVSIFGALLCLVLMFFSGWYFAVAALIFTGAVYKYIEYGGAKREWGDGLRGLDLQAARYSLLRLEEGPPHTKNWRPQVLVLCKLDDNLIPSQPKLLSFASQLKAGKGLALVYSVLKGKYSDSAQKLNTARKHLKRFVNDRKVEGFCKVIASSNITEGLSYVIQGAGLGGMAHNTLVVTWPDSWRKKTSWHLFVSLIRMAAMSELAMLVPKGINWFPSNSDQAKGNIDVWWIVHDGGLLLLLPFLLKRHKVWKNCSLRIFTIAEMDDNSIQMKRDLEKFLYQLRMQAEVHIIEMPDSDISAYTYERTLIMEQRNDLLTKLRLNKSEAKGDVQNLIARSFSRRSSNAAVKSSPSLSTISLVSQNSQQEGGLTTEPVEPPSPKLLSLKISQAAGESQVGVASTPVLKDVDDDTSSLASSFGGDMDDEPKPLLLTSHANAPVADHSPFQGAARSVNEGVSLLTAGTSINAPKVNNVKRMNTSVKLNELIVTTSHDSALVIVNLPSPPHEKAEEENYMEYLEVLTEGLQRVLMVRGGGREVITIYS